MTGTGHLLIADFRKSATASDVQDLVAKLHRRGFWTTLLDPGSPLPAGAVGLAVILDDFADRSQALRTVLGQAQSTGIPVVAWLDGAEPSKVSGHLPPSVILVQGRDASRDRALSRFANAIASASAGPIALEPSAAAAQGSPEPGPTAPGGAVWSWPGAMLGPLWPVAAARPLAGFLGLALLIAGTVVAASLARSPLAPLVGFAGAWLAFAVLMGLFGGERAPGEADERWFRPVGALALAVVVGFVAVVGWSKAQSERAALEPQMAEATGNPVLVGRQPSNWNWDASWWEGIGELPFPIGGIAQVEVGDGLGGISSEPSSNPIIPTDPPTIPPQVAGGDCDDIKAQAGSDWENDSTYIIFCGDQPKAAPQ